MTVKELRCIYSSIWNAKDVIENLACEDYPYTEFADSDICAMFYQLNDMCLTLTSKMDELKGE